MLSQREDQDEIIGDLCVHVRSLCILTVLIGVAGHVYICMYVYVAHTHTRVHVCVRMPTGNTCSASLLVGSGIMELWQPCLSQAVRSSLILLTHTLEDHA